MSEEIDECRTLLRAAERRAKEAESAAQQVKRSRTKIAIWSALGGFFLFALGGHWIPGYQLDSTAQATASETAQDSVSDVVAQFCAQRFMRAPDLDTQLKALDNEFGEWSKANFIQKGPWADTPHGERPDHDTAEKCHRLIAEKVLEAAPKSS
jgi:hypothetical protein